MKTDDNTSALDQPAAMRADLEGAEYGSRHWIGNLPEGECLFTWYGDHFGYGGGTYSLGEIDRFGWTYLGPVLTPTEVATLKSDLTIAQMDAASGKTSAAVVAAIAGERAKFREALTFYADPVNWINSPSWDGDPECISEKAIPVTMEDGRPCDCGDRARAALASVQNAGTTSVTTPVFTRPDAQRAVDAGKYTSLDWFVAHNTPPGDDPTPISAWCGQLAAVLDEARAEGEARMQRRVADMIRTLAYYAAPDHYDGGDVTGHLYILDDAGGFAREALGMPRSLNVDGRFKIEMQCREMMSEPSAPAIPSVQGQVSPAARPLSPALVHSPMENAVSALDRLAEDLCEADAAAADACLDDATNFPGWAESDETRKAYFRQRAVEWMRRALSAPPSPAAGGQP